MPDAITPTSHQLVFTDEDYKKAAKRYEKSLLQIPLLAIAEILKYFTPMAGVRYKVALGAIESQSEFAPYDPNRKAATTTKITSRDLSVELGSVIEDFEPNAHLQELIGAAASFLGDGQKAAPSAKLVIASVARSLGAKLGRVLFTAVRNASGNKSADLFDGFNTIITKEIAAGAISKALGNLETVEAITGVNAVDVFKAMERGCDDELREQEKFLFCAPEYGDLYNDAYLTTHNAVPYNDKYEQAYVEGSNKRTTIVPLSCMAGINRVIITPKWNMIYGFDSLSDIERLQVDRFSPFMLTLSALMFFGVQIKCIDKRVFKVYEVGTTGQQENPGEQQEGEEH